MPPVMFKDVSKKASDLLKKDFVSSHEFEIKNATAAGLTFTATGKRNRDNGVDLDFEVEYNDKAAGVKVKEKLTNDKDMTLEVSVANKLVDGLKVGVESTTNTGRPKEIKGFVEYQNKSSSSAVSVDDQLNVEASTVVQYDKFLVGAKTKFEGAKGNVASADVVASYSGAEATVTAGMNSFKQEVTGTYLYNLSNLSATLAGTVTYNTSTSANTYAVGGSYQLQNGHVVKAKIESTGRLHMVYSQKMNPNLTLALGTTINTSKLGEEKSQDVGVSIKYNPSA